MEMNAADPGKVSMDILSVYSRLSDMLKKQIPPLRAKVDNQNQLEVSGTKETMQGKQKVDGIFFACLVLKPKDVRLYFFPVYTHEKEFQLSPELKKMLKGKSCFHIKSLSDPIATEIDEMIRAGIELYKRDAWL